MSKATIDKLKSDAADIESKLEKLLAVQKKLEIVAKETKDKIKQQKESAVVSLAAFVELQNTLKMCKNTQLIEQIKHHKSTLNDIYTVIDAFEKQQGKVIEYDFRGSSRSNKNR